jgi:hypothetical protein
VTSNRKTGVSIRIPSLLIAAAEFTGTARAQHVEYKERWIQPASPFFVPERPCIPENHDCSF